MTQLGGLHAGRTLVETARSVLVVDRHLVRAQVDRAAAPDHAVPPRAVVLRRAAMQDLHVEDPAVGAAVLQRLWPPRRRWRRWRRHVVHEVVGDDAAPPDYLHVGRAGQHGSRDRVAPDAVGPVGVHTEAGGRVTET